MLVSLVPALLASALMTLPAQGEDQAREEAWVADLMLIFERLESLHPELFHALPEEEYNEAVDALFDRIPELSDDEITVELMRLFARVGGAGRDGSTVASAWRRFDFLPLRVYRFADGWFVTESASNEELVGSRLEAIGGVPVEEVCERLAPVQSRDNDMDLVGRLALLMVRPQLLHLMGVIPERDHATVMLVDADGEAHEVTLDAGPLEITGFRYPFWGTRLPVDPDLPWLAKHEGSWSFRFLAGTSGVYVRYDAVFAQENTGRTQVEFVDQFLAAAEESGAERILIDVRANGGGNAHMFRPLVDKLRSSPWNARGRLFCLIGRATFGAGAQFVDALQTETEVVLVGEATGGAPSRFGEAKWIRLPDREGLVIRIASERLQPRGPDDFRLTIEPDLRVELSSADYFAGRDPVLEAALGFQE